MSDLKSLISRRDALARLGLGAGAVVVGSRVPAFLGGSGVAEAASCTLTAETTAGPYWVPNNLTRRDVRDGQPGRPLVLDLYVEDASTCKPISGADVEIWHANAAGAYSGVQGNTKRFLRGHQKTNARGLATFTTIYPGWYPGRTPHIHVKVHAGGNVVHTGQLFLPDAVSASVYRTGAYAAHGQQNVRNSNDNIFIQAGRGKAVMTMRNRGSKGYVGSMVMVVNRG
jgi:protocatechuate 3,4-dioxygenase beta subunit